MARKSTPMPLTLDDSTNAATASTDAFAHSPLSPISPKSPRSPFSKFSSTGKKLQKERDREQPGTTTTTTTASQQAATTTSADSSQPQSQSKPPSHNTSSFSSPTTATTNTSTSTTTSSSEKPDRPTRSGFFSNYKAAKSASRLQQNSESARQVQEDMSRDNSDRAGGGHVSSKDKPRSESSRDRSSKRKPVPGPKSSDISVDTPVESISQSTPSAGKKNKPKPFALLNRSRSMRDEPSPKESPPLNQSLEPGNTQNEPQPLRAAPPQHSERSLREMVTSNVRQRSGDRRPTATREPSQGREINRHQASFSSTGHAFLSNLRGTAVKGAGALSKGLFGKGGRSASTTERETPVDDEHYVVKVLNLGLVEQTRVTRISKRLESSRDKTEFWMPAFPWRAIDYLNYKGTEAEGLYRVPGSAHEIKKWQRRFDEEHDIDLFEQGDLYDINIIGSMLKSWLRELPDEIFPKASQERVQREAPQSETVPQVLIDELSNLPPFNYYLLFAITCHLSLLLAHSDKNKMGYHNLLICFQPSIKIDAYCFRFLVCEWRDCWKGCNTENKWIAEEYKLFEPQPPNSAEGSVAVESLDERNISSSDSGKQPTAREEKLSYRDQGKQTKKSNLPLSQSNGSLSTIQSTTLSVREEQTPTRQELKRLSPIKPLSPLGL